MKIVSPSFKILPDDLGLAERIEYTGRVCYKSEDKITPDSSAGFCRGMTNHKHNSVLEMGVRSYLIKSNFYDYICPILKSEPKFLVIDDLGNQEWLITGSVRAFREMLMRLPESPVFRAIAFDINKKHPYFFEDISSLLQKGESEVIYCKQVLLKDIDRLTPDLQSRHRHVAVKFVVNRAVTHEIVRHRPCAFLQESQRYCRYGEGKFGSEVTFIKPMFFKEDSEAYQLWKESMLLTEERYLNILALEKSPGKPYSAQAARTVLPNSCKTELFLYAPLTEWHHILHMRTSKAAEPSMREVMIPLQQEFIKRWPEQNFGEPLRMPEGYIDN